LAQNKMRFDRTNFVKKILDDMKEALPIFKNYGSLKLFMKIEYEYASIRLDMAKAKIGTKTPDSLVDHMRQISKKTLRNQK